MSKDLTRDVQLFEDDKGMRKGLSLQRSAPALKRLSARHRQMIAMHLNGLSNNEIAEIMSMSPSRVSIVLHDPLAREIIDAALENADRELAALYPSAVDSIKRGLNAPEAKDYLKAADLFFKTQGKYKDPEDDKNTKVTAEDVAKQVIQIRGEATITTETGRRIQIENKSEDE